MATHWLQTGVVAGTCSINRHSTAPAQANPYVQESLRLLEIIVIELPPREAALVLREEIKGGNHFGRYFGVTVESSLEDFERATVRHPVFLLQSVA